MKVNTRTEIFLLLICVPLALILISPLFHVLMRAGEVNPQKAIDYFSRSGTLAIIGRSLLLVAAVSFTSCLIAVPAAWLTMRTDLIGRNLWTILLILPLVIPSYIGAFAMIGAIGQKGFFQGLL